MSNETTTVKLAAIRIDGDTQLRTETNQDVIANYARDMQEGDLFPPLVVFYDGTNYWLSDGFHRYFAAKEIGKDEILTTVREGTRRDALLYAAEANRKHGLTLSNKDKRRIVTLFLNDPEWSQWSDREIARRCGVSNTFVSNIRVSLSTVDSEERTYITKYGTQSTMNVTRIGTDPYEGLSDSVIRELEETNAPPDTIAKLAEYARKVKSDIKGNAARALLIGSWMLGCAEGDCPHIGDPPYTKEQLEKEGFEIWSLTPEDIGGFLEIGKLERILHDKEVNKGKDFFDVKGEDMLSNLSYDIVLELANLYVNVVFNCCYTIFHYLTLRLSQDAKDKLANGEIPTIAEAYKYDAEIREKKIKKVV